MLALLLAIDDPAAFAARAAAMTAATPHCTISVDTTDVTVCGLRQADRFRVPFTGQEAGHARYEPVAVERKRLLHRTNPVHDLSPFLVGGGMAGVTVGTAGSGGLDQRRLAP